MSARMAETVRRHVAWATEFERIFVLSAARLRGDLSPSPDHVADTTSDRPLPRVRRA